MKNCFKLAALFFGVALTGMTSCDDAKYKSPGVQAFINESAQNKSTKVTITDQGAKAGFTICLSDVVSQDVKLRIVIDPAVLDKYNEKQASSFLVLPDDVFEIPSEVTIGAGDYSAPAIPVIIKPLPAQYVGESYALPIRLESVDGSVGITSTTATYVITTEAIISASLPQFTGGAGLSAAGFPVTLPQFTVECRFQVSNTANRNRAVFTNGGSVLMRFEDPQNKTGSVEAHSLVQFQGEGWYLNPSMAFDSNKWQHMAITYDGVAVRLYVNGAFAGSKEGTANSLFAGAYWFGGDAGGGHGTGDTWWNGCKILCSELRIWSVCRTDAQIQNNMTTTSAKSQGLVAYWRMTEGSGKVFTDVSGNGHTLSTSANVTWVPNIKSTDVSTPFL